MLLYEMCERQVPSGISCATQFTIVANAQINAHSLLITNFLSAFHSVNKTSSAARFIFCFLP